MVNDWSGCKYLTILRTEWLMQLKSSWKDENYDYKKKITYSQAVKRPRKFRYLFQIDYTDLKIIYD